MAIITISRGSYSRGKEIAEKVAERLDYKCISRDALIEASEQFNIPEMKLIRAIHDAPSILERFGYSKEKYITYIQAALLRHAKKDNFVYHGLAGHFFFEGIPHVLKVRILSDIERRIALEMERDNISQREAEHNLKGDDEQRREWGKYLYGIDTADASLYDLVLHIKNITVDDAVNIICHTVKLPDFQTTAHSQKVLEDHLLASEVKAALIDLKPDINISASDGLVMVKTKAHMSEDERLFQDIKGIGESIPGVKELHFDVYPKRVFD